jgi:hypothetical protein
MRWDQRASTRALTQTALAAAVIVMRELFATLLKNEDGVTAVEYGIFTGCHATSKRYGLYRKKDCEH